MIKWREIFFCRCPRGQRIMHAQKRENIRRIRHITCRVQKHRLVWPSPATSQAKLKEHLDRNAAGTFPSHCDSLGLRNENPPSLLNRTTLGAAYSPARREIYLASRSYLAPSRLYYLLVSIALCSPWFSPEKAYRQYMRLLFRYLRSSPLRLSSRVPASTLTPLSVQPCAARAARVVFDYSKRACE